MKDSSYLKINENELMKYFGYEGKFGKIKLNLKIFHLSIKMSTF